MKNNKVFISVLLKTVFIGLFIILGYLLDSYLDTYFIECGFKVIITLYLSEYFFRKAKNKSFIINKFVPVVLISLLVLISILVLNDKLSIIFHVTFLYVLATSIFEELFYRKYILEKFKISKFDPVKVHNASLFFGASHLFVILLAPDNWLFYTIFALITVYIGMFLCYIYLKYKNIYLNILIHFLINFIYFVISAVCFEELTLIDLIYAGIYLILVILFYIILGNKDKNKCISYI